MTEEKPLTAILTPKVDTENLDDFKSGVAEAFSQAMADANVTSELGFTITIDEQMMKRLEETVASLGQTFANFSSPLSELNKSLSSLQSSVPQVTSAVNGAVGNGASAESKSVLREENQRNFGALRKENQERLEILKGESQKKIGILEKIASKFDSLGTAGSAAGGMFSGGAKVIKDLDRARASDDKGEYYKASLARLDAIKTIGDTGFNSLFKLGSAFMEIFEKLWKMIVDSSPLLRSVLGLFDTALSLIFMPIGNKIAELMIPSIVDIMDRIGDIWTTMDDLYEQGGLGAMLGYAIELGVTILFEKIESFINVLQGSNTDWMVAIGDLLAVIVSLAKSTLIPTLVVIMNAVTFVLNHLKEFTITLVGLYTGFKVSVAVAHRNILTQMKSINTNMSKGFKTLNDTIKLNLKGLGTTIKVEGQKNRLLTKLATKLGLVSDATKSATQGAQMATLVGPMTPGAVAAGMLGAIASMVITGLAMEALGLKSGGYVPATEGGELHVLAEGGEGEFVVPESKAQKFAEDYGKATGTTGGNTYNIVINGYTDSELKQFIVDVVNDRSSLSRIRAGF